MDIEALRTFIAINRSGTVTGAAAALFRSQPAVSRRLALLENELNVPLFERVPGGVVLSEAGRALLPFAEAVLASVQDAEEAVRAVRSQDSGPVTIALVGTLASTSLTVVLRAFAQKHPDVQLTLRTATSQQVSDLVRRADVAVGLRYSTDPAPELHCDRLYSERLVIVAAPDHARAGTRISALNVLADERWIAFPELPGRPEASGEHVRRVLDAAGVADGQILRIDSLTAQKRLVEAGFGIALVPDSSVQEELAAGSLVGLEVDGLDVTIPVVLVTRRNGYLTAATRTLLAELRQAGVTGEPLLSRGRPAPPTPGRRGRSRKDPSRSGRSR
jgi:DNA-binding transcriptional LysR family regulator